MRLTVSEISAYIDAGNIDKSFHKKYISELLTDSRKLVHPDETAFFALSTQLRDGHSFIDGLYQKGVRCFVVGNQYNPDVERYPDAIFLNVHSPLRALQSLCAAYRRQFQIPVIAITGSNGKTVVKEWMFHLLSQKFRTLRSPKSYNSQTGVPLSVALLNKEHEYAVFEAGISQAGEMEFLEKIIQPQFGIFTNIGPPHDENFSEIAEKITEKAKLFAHVQQLVLCDEHKQIVDLCVKTNQLTKNQLFLWGKHPDSQVQILHHEQQKDSTLFKVRVKDCISEFRIPFIDDASTENAMHCFSAMMMLGFSPGEVAEHMLTLPVISMRLEMHNGINGCLIINDAYNSDMHSLTIALDFLKQHQQERSSCVILSDILQTGVEAQELYQQAATLIAQHHVTKFIGIGPAVSSMRQVFNNIPETLFFESTGHFISNVKLSDFQNEIILVKGARNFTFEQIVKQLEYKSHQTVLEVNLSAIQHNLNIYRSMLSPGTGVMAMVKAFSYGTGSHEIASMLEYHRISYLGVAYADEGVELRNKGITMPIMVMAPEEASVDAMIANNLEPEIYNFESLQWLKKVTQEIVKIHIKFDTGMHRLGFHSGEIPELCSQLKLMPNIIVVSVFSHLANADDSSEMEFSLRQVQLFDSMCELFSLKYGSMPLRHILNSAGIDSLNHAQYDMVRLGLGLYGIQPSSEKELSLIQAVRLKTRIIQIKKVAKNERIGYGNLFTVSSAMDIAIIPIGYADGFRRSLSNGKGHVFIQGRKCKVVGNVCMDLTMIDVSHLDVSVGDPVVIFDELHSVTEFAKEMNVIPYEVLTGISNRVKRQYVME